MNEGVASNIKQILSSYETAIAIHENPLWVQSVSAEDIKVAFKLGCFIEKTTDNFIKKNCQRNFIKALKTWRETNNKTLNQIYNSDFFLKMNDHILVKFFKCQKTNEKILDLAIRMYTSVYPKERLKDVFTNLINKSASYQAIAEFVAVNNNTNNCDFKFHLVLNDLLLKYNSNREEVTNIITESLSNFRVQDQNSLPLLIGILSLKIENSVTNLILNSILTKMLDRSILSKNFWLALLKNTDIKHLKLVCSHNENFLVSFCNYLIYIGSMMEKQRSTWIINSNINLCPEILYNELVSLFKSLCDTNESVKKFVINKLSEAQSYTSSAIFDEITTKCL